MKNKSEKNEPENIQAEPETVPEKYLCIPVPCRGPGMIPFSGVELMNEYFVKGWKFLYEKSFGVNERFFYFERMDK